MSDTVFELWHVYEIESDVKIPEFKKFVGAFSRTEKMYYDFETFIGIFSSEEKC